MWLGDGGNTHERAFNVLSYRGLLDETYTELKAAALAQNDLFDGPPAVIPSKSRRIPFHRGDAGLANTPPR